MSDQRTSQTKSQQQDLEPTTSERELIQGDMAYEESAVPDHSRDPGSGFAALHPVLQQALGSLDVDLEDELARYRRQSLGQARRSRPDANAYVAALAQKSRQTSSPTAAAGAIAQSTAEAQTFQAHLTNLATAPAAASGTATGDLPAPDRYLESSEELLRSLEDMHLSLDDMSPEAVAPEAQSEAKSPGLLTSLLTPLGMGSILLLILSSATLGYLVVNPSVIGRLAAPAEGGRAGLEGQDAAGRPEGISPDLASNEFDPLDLNRLSSIPTDRPSASLEELATNPDGATDEADAGTTGDAADENAGSLPSVSVPGAVATQSPRSPAPATQPSTVTPAPASSSPRAAAPSRPVPSRSSQQQSAPQRSTPSQAAARPQVEAAPTLSASSTSGSSSSAQSSSPAPSSSSSSSNSSPSRSGAASSSSGTVASSSGSQSSGSQGEYVYVVTPYTGDNSLEQAQQAVSGAYVRNFPQGAQVQMGAFSNPQGAQDLVQELNSQGIQAEILD